MFFEEEVTALHSGVVGDGLRHVQGAGHVGGGVSRVSVSKRKIIQFKGLCTFTFFLFSNRLGISQFHRDRSTAVSGSVVKVTFYLSFNLSSGQNLSLDIVNNCIYNLIIVRQ